MDPGARDLPFDGEELRVLRELLASSLPGERAHRIALPAGSGPRDIPDETSARAAAVLLALHPDGSGGVRFPMIRRTTGLDRHSGQIALPGGVLELDESEEAGALREAHEEIGLPPAQVAILGRLTPIVIPVSGYRVQPIVGWNPAPPAWRPDPREVVRIVSADPDRLVAEGLSSFHPGAGRDRPLPYPAYRVDGETVWGATAMILAEFLAVWSSLRRLPRPGEGRGV